MRRIASGLLVVLVVLSATGTSYAFLRCRFTGLVMRAGCCPPIAAGQVSERAPSVLSGDPCCDRVTVHVSRVPSEAACAGTGDVGLGAAVAVVTPDVTVPLAVPPPPRPAIRPPPWRASLTLLKSSFLI